MHEPKHEAGALIINDETVFTVWAPLKTSMNLFLPDADVKYPMHKDDKGYWSAVVKKVGPGTRYLFEADDFEQPLPDPASRCQPYTVHDASVVTSKTFSWTDFKWKGLSLDQMIIYELHTGTFTEAGTFAEIISKLPYLKELGVNTIELMPVAQFPGDRNWGYDGVYPFAVQQSYGGIEGLKQLVDKAHEAGIAVILDVVYNHLGPEGNYLASYAPYFTDKYKTGWGNAINFDDAWCDGVRDYFIQNALMWLDEFHIDGLRLDAVHAIWDFSAKHFIEVLNENVRALEKKTGRKKVLIAEFDLNNPRYINSSSKGGYGLDGQWMDEFHHALHAMIMQERNGYYEDFGEAYHLAKAIQDSYVYTGQYSEHRKKYFGVATDNPYHQFVVFAQNHDQIGNRLLGDRLTATLSFEALKLAAATILLSPHVPLLFMGEEYGEKNPFQYFISHTDKQLVELVRKGRKEEFKHFGWQEEVPDPQDPDTFNKCKLSWNLEHAENATLFAFYKHLIHFRKEHPAMKSFDRDATRVISCENNIIIFERKNDMKRICIILNLNKTKTPLKPPVNGDIKKIFDSSSRDWDGPGESIGYDSTQLLLNPQSAVILEL